jgi:hypothetical protein
MHDLREALKRVEQNDPPDLWPLVRDREAGSLPPPVGSHARRWSTILVAAVISVLALGFAWRAFGSSSVTPGGEPSVTPSASETTSPGFETVFVSNGPESDNGPDTGEFAPPPAGASPAVPFDEAIDVFLREHPGIQLDHNTFESLGVGSYTAVNADGSIRFEDKLAYGIHLHVCVAQSPPSCDLWIFIDANTGHLLESAWRQ